MMITWIAFCKEFAYLSLPPYFERPVTLNYIRTKFFIRKFILFIFLNKFGKLFNFDSICEIFKNLYLKVQCGRGNRINSNVIFVYLKNRKKQTHLLITSFNKI